MLADDKKKFLLERACEFGHMNYQDLINMCRAGHAFFHDKPNGAAITCIVQSGETRIMYVMAMGANKKGVSELREAVVEHARQENCQYVQTKGRLGFEKARVKRYSDAMEGFEPVGILYELNLRKSANVKQTPGPDSPSSNE